VGSSNLTHSAQITGLEWNVRASSARNPDVLSKFEAVFESYWQSVDFVEYDTGQFDTESQRAGRTDTEPTVILSPIELRLEPFQERLMEQLALSRERGHHRNLLVAATGTGKTVMAAVDYARLRDDLSRSRLLFVAHRNEILDQSLATFRYALRNASLGRNGSVGRGQNVSTTYSLQSKASMPQAWNTLRPIISTSSLSTSSTMRRHLLTASCSTMCSRANCSA
jgi:hypothetical protein